MKKVSFVVAKPLQYYKGILIKADTGLHDQLAEVVLSIMPQGAKLLDFGAGEGALSQRLQDMGYDVRSVDIDSGNFKARTAFERLDFNDRAAVDSCCRTHADEFDLVLGIEVIEHVQNPWEYVVNLKSMVRPGGYIILSTPNISSWYSRLSFFLNGRFHQFEDGDRHYGHISPIAEDELRLICERAGLVVEGIRPGGWLPRLWLSWHPTTLLKNLFGFFSSFLMKGSFNGWCLIAIIRKP